MTAESAPKLGTVPESGRRERTGTHFALSFRGKAFKLNLPEIILGRAATAHISILSPLASRHHARIVISATGPMLEDLRSRNGTFLNSVALQQPTLLCIGDTISVGDEILEVIVLAPDPRDQKSATLAQMTAVKPTLATTPKPPISGFTSGDPRSTRTDFSDDDASLATRAADVFELLGTVADKMITLGRHEDAERLLSGHLRNALKEARTGAQLSNSLCEQAANYALKLADAASRAPWLDYVVELYSARRAPMPLQTVERLYTLIPRLRGLNVTALKSYVTLLASQSHTLTPAERFVLQRLEGLQKLA